MDEKRLTPAMGERLQIILLTLVPTITLEVLLVYADKLVWQRGPDY